jgi:hypothetical protein
VKYKKFKERIRILKVEYMTNTIKKMLKKQCEVKYRKEKKIEKEAS